MTRRGTYMLTAIAAGLLLFLTWAFADGLVAGMFWNTSVSS